ncbi:MAG: energy-coupling factor transporter ATPase [Syntrophales bacterium]
MIEIENLIHRYPFENAPVLKGIDLVVREGEYIAILGPNGCGKTTLIRHLNALLFPTSGSVRIDGMSTNDPRSLREIRRRVGMVFQNPDSQIVAMTVEEDVAFGPGNLGLPPAKIRQRVDKALAEMGITSLAKRPPHTLSGGEKRLVAVAGILAMEPSYVAFDEPTSYLDPPGRGRVLDAIRKLKQRGLSIIHVTHDVEDVIESDRVLIMDCGRLVISGPPRQVFSRVDELKSLGLGVPWAAELMWRLKQDGADVRTDILTIDQACDEISAWKNRCRIRKAI